MKLIKFEAKQRISKNSFKQNEIIEELYFEIAEMVLVKLYNAFPFHSLFEGFSWENKANEFFQSALTEWADCFMSWNISNMDRAKKAVNFIIKKNVVPSAGLVLSAYKGNLPPIEKCEYESYIDYVYSLSSYSDGVQMSNKVLVFSEWKAKNTNKGKL